MGAMVEKCMIFPAPPSTDEYGHPRSPNIIWDELPEGMPGGGVRRPFLWLEAPESLGTVIYFHANAEDVGRAEAWLQMIHRNLGVNVLAVEYPGYGLLQTPEVLEDLDTASTIINMIDHAAVHALQYAVLSKGVPSSRVLLYGRSIGSGPALRLAAYAREQLQWSLGGIVLQSPCLSTAQVACDLAGAVGSFLVPAYYDNLAALRRLCAEPRETGAIQQWMPLLILHGEQDDIVAPYHGRTLLQEAQRHGHPSAEAVFPPSATHDQWDVDSDVVLPIADFLVRRVFSFAGSAKPACGAIQTAGEDPLRRLDKSLLVALQGALVASEALAASEGPAREQEGCCESPAGARAPLAPL